MILVQKEGFGGTSLLRSADDGTVCKKKAMIFAQKSGLY